MILNFYRGISYFIYPFLMMFLYRRRQKGKEDAVRYKERFGFYSIERPKGHLVWIHCASVGESLSIIPLVRRLVLKSSVLVTTGTVTSAELMEKRLPKGAFHQYVPVDYPTFVRRFMRYFHPDVGFFVESDFWPNMMLEAQKCHVPLILLNGRISDHSFEEWQKKALFFIRALLRVFVFCLGQTDEDARRLSVLGAVKTDCVGNLKFSATDMPFDENEFHSLILSIKDRPVWVASSTHDNEEEQIGQIVVELKKKYPTLLTVLVPRHPHRAKNIASQLSQMGLSVHQRSLHEDMSCDIYLGDTIGEMGLYYRLAPIVFVGGSLIEWGGQNMLEPMRLGACTLVGPFTMNFREIIKKAKQFEAIIEVQNKDELKKALSKLFTNNIERQQLSRKGQLLACQETAVLNRVCKCIEPWTQL